MSGTAAVPNPPQPPSTSPLASPQQSSTKQTNRPSRSAVSKPGDCNKTKQTKSRNGCVTCKKKRLKCDERKPGCDQCARRSVVCGGYKKDYKWRPFEEQSFSHQKTDKPKLGVQAASSSFQTTNSGSASRAGKNDKPQDTHSFSSFSSFTPSNLPAAEKTGSFRAPETLEYSVHPESRASGSPDQGSSIPLHFATSHHSTFSDTTFAPRGLSQDVYNSHANSTDSPSSWEEGPSPKWTSSQPHFSGRSPTLAELLLPGTDPATGLPPGISASDERQEPREQAAFSELNGGVAGYRENLEDDVEDDDVEEILRQSPYSDPGSLNLFDFHLDGFDGNTSLALQDDPLKLMYKEPQLLRDSAEMILTRFDRLTCGIMSIRNGQRENPWRTLVMPLMSDHPVVFHAIASMASFHSSKNEPAFHTCGAEHMHNALTTMSRDSATIRTDIALAVTLGLAFAEGWGDSISTGINYIQMSRGIVVRALREHHMLPLAGKDLKRLRFLCKTWIYIDVIARLTSTEDDDSLDFEKVAALIADPQQDETEIDPLMGCASSLFSLVGRVANLVRRVCKTEVNTPAMIEQAAQLKLLVETWLPTGVFEAPEDPSSPVEHSLQTAEAYRYATLLYLHQAFPEIPSLPSEVLAKNALAALYKVPLESGTVIVQIYPLLATGCEAIAQEDRQWIQDRWKLMSTRMSIGNIDRCSEVVKEVWSRRDRYTLNQTRRDNFANGQTYRLDGTFSSWADAPDPFLAKRRITAPFGISSSGRDMEKPDVFQNPHMQTVGLDPEYTVRGRLHWVGVMKNWQWEVLLG